MTASPQTLFDIAGIQARIHSLPGRPPFMTASDLAEVYGTGAKRLTEAVKRNIKRFPDDFAFRLTEAETALLKSQSATSMMANRDFPMAFTQAGAYALSGVLTSDVAIEVGIAIYRAFAAMEAAALADAKAMVQRLRTEQLCRQPLRVRIAEGVRNGLSFEDICRQGSAPRWKVAEKAHECLSMGIIDRLPAAMPLRQGDLFSHV